MDKPIKLAGFSATTPLARQLIASKPTGMISMEQVPMLAVFILESTTFNFVGSRHVPQLRLVGRLARLIPENPEEMPYRIGEIALSEEESIRVVGDYPFNTDQLGVLVKKGLYMDGFGPSEDWVNLPFEVDTNIDLRVMPPHRDGAPPLAIADLSPMRYFDMSLESSQYELAGYFPDYRAAQIEAGAITGNEPLGVEPSHLQGQADLSGFSFGTGRDEIDLSSVIGQDGKSIAERLSTLMDVPLTAPKALRGLREDLRGEETRAERARANLASPGLSELYDQTTGSVHQAPPAQPSIDELSRAAEQLDDIDLEDLDLSGFSFGDDETPGDTDENLIPTMTISTPEPIVASVIAEDDEVSAADTEDDDKTRARKARVAREAAARRTRQNQQLSATRHLPSGNAAPTTDNDGPQLGG